MGNIAYFEVPAEDVERAKKFYKEVLGWEINKTKMEPSPPDYQDISTGKIAEGAMNTGGMYKWTKDMGPRAIVNYAHVPDIDKALEAAQKLGGVVVMPKMEIKTVGHIAQVKDTEGNVIGLWQPEKK